MHPIIYDVAVSIDGFISGPGGDISQFPAEGSIVTDYLERLSTYRTVIMGRATYEFGYRFGLVPGRNPYAHARCVIVSSGIELSATRDVEVIAHPTVEGIEQIRAASDGPVYLCGGGVLAGWMLDHGLIDILRIKRAPAVLGSGTPLFANVRNPPTLEHVETKAHDGGVFYQEWRVA